MLTNRTNRTLSATTNGLILGTRSLALVADVNTLQANAFRSRVSHPHVGRTMRAGMYPKPLDPDSIRGDWPGIPGSPSGPDRPGMGRSCPSQPWSHPPFSVRPEVERVVVVRRQRRAVQAQACAAAADLAAAGRPAGRSDRAPVAMKAALRPTATGG